MIRNYEELRRKAMHGTAGENGYVVSVANAADREAGPDGSPPAPAQISYRMGAQPEGA